MKDSTTVKSPHISRSFIHVEAPCNGITVLHYAELITRGILVAVQASC
jgi:hypothetical protein